MSAAAPIVEGLGERSELRAAARVDEENGRLSLLSGERDVEQIMRDERDAAGEAMALNGASGLLVGSGSLAEIIAESARQRDRDIRIRRTQATGENRNLLQAAKDKRKAGKNALIGGVFSGVANALGGVNAQRNAGRRDTQSGKERSYR